MYLIRIVQKAIKFIPSTFNTQTSRAVVVLGPNNKKVWNIIKTKFIDTLPEDQKEYHLSKLPAFSGGYGSVLFFEDRTSTDQLAQNMPA
jgi:uncharacterized protein